MVESYRTVYLGGEEEIVEKKSRFIAAVEHVESEEEALAFVEAVRRKHWNARHHCYAFITGTGSQPLMRCSDDGEPSGTAGRPMLDVLTGEGLCNIVVVVTRYFGGTLLRTGGLVRAYSGAVKAGLEGSILITRKLARRLEINCDYTWFGKIRYLAEQQQLDILETSYGSSVRIVLLVPVQECDAFAKRITEATNGQAVISEAGEVYYARTGTECLLFDH